jgi:hypothetical protein
VETSTAELGDKRLNRRFGHVLALLSRRPADNIPAACKSWNETKAAYRFFDHEEVNDKKVLAPHCDATVERMKNETVVLLLQDTTELDFTSKSQTQGLGRLTYEKQRGMYLHPTLAVTPERVCLGVVDTQILIREDVRKEEKIRHETLPIESKESVRWLRSYQTANRLAKKLSKVQIVNIADREGDIYEVFVEASGAKETGGADWIIRGNQDRLLNSQEGPRKIRASIGKMPVLGVVEFDLPRAEGRKARRVKQEIRAKRVTLKAPYRKGNQLPSVSINVVLASEIDAPTGVEPIEWLLLTSLSISTIKSVMCVIEWYLCRWQIELFFKILKSGCGVEKLQLQTVERLGSCIAMYLIIAWRVLYLTMLGRKCPDILCDVAFEDEEWRAVWIVVKRSQPPQVVPKLNTIIIMIASLGGFLNRKGDGFPGSKTIWIGLQRTRDFVAAMEAQKTIGDMGND